MADFHVYPLNDLHPHTTEGLHCECAPTITAVYANGNQVIVHHAFDYREFIEDAEDIKEQTELTLK